MASTDHGAWDLLPGVKTPALLVAGEESTTHQEPFLGQLAGRFANARYEIIPGTSHFVWMETPGVIAERVVAAVGNLR